MKNQISKYVVTWIELSPAKGIVTKHDRKQFGDLYLHGKDKKFFLHFKDRQSALNWIAGFGKRLDKQYTCRLFTDAQFSKSRYEDGQIIIPFTTKQRNEVYIIG